MSTIQNLKNFIRHGKQARTNQNPHADPTTSVSPVHAQQQRYQKNQQHAISDPTIIDNKPLQYAGRVGEGNYSVAGLDNKNIAAQAAAAAAHHAGAGQKIHQQPKTKEYDPVLEKIVAEERESKGKFPKYPGLERFRLVEKMGDGAFSNVYRAKDLTGEYEEVAIKVVRKHEMNTSQVCWELSTPRIILLFLQSAMLFIFPFLLLFELHYHHTNASLARAINICIRISRSSPKVSRYLYILYYFARAYHLIIREEKTTMLISLAGH